MSTYNRETRVVIVFRLKVLVLMIECIAFKCSFFIELSYFLLYLGVLGYVHNISKSLLMSHSLLGNVLLLYGVF
jgi:hypothetical protein